MLQLDILNQYKPKNFSFNLIWDDLILKEILFGEIMSSDWYHVGDKQGLEEIRKIVT